MSRIGRQPVMLGEAVTAIAKGSSLEVSGPLGKLVIEVPVPIEVEVEEAEKRLVVRRPNNQKRNRALHGLVRALAANMVTGVSEGFTKKLAVVGVGYNAKAQGKRLVLNVGYSNPVEVAIPEGIAVETPGPLEIAISGIDKQKVGQFAAEVRGVRPPEPYKGKGIRYADEQIRRKQGKAFVSGGS